ncbi:Xylose operon regulatory protein [compost metagenome]
MKQLSSCAEKELLYWKKHILTDIWHFCLSSHTSSNAVEEHQHDPLVEQAVHVLQQYGYGELSIVRLASELGISPVQLSRRFSKQTGQTPSAYLTALRLEKAKTLLTETRLPLEQIAQQCGFSNGFYLSRVFTKALKINPSVYRRLNQV